MKAQFKDKLRGDTIYTIKQTAILARNFIYLLFFIIDGRHQKALI